MKIAPPRLPPAPAAGRDRWAADLTTALNDTLRAVIQQLNGLSAGEISNVTNAQNAAPTTGQHARGDFVRNSLPAAGGVFGWVCVQSGTPGVWRPVTIGA